jgi:hypothetical protein
VQRFIPFNKDDGFIRGLALRVLLARDFVKLEVLLAQKLYGLDIVLSLVFGDGALKDPTAGEMIRQGIFGCGLLCLR